MFLSGVACMPITPVKAPLRPCRKNRMIGFGWRSPGMAPALTSSDTDAVVCVSTDEGSGLPAMATALTR